MSLRDDVRFIRALAGPTKCEAVTEPVVWAHEDAPFTGAQVRDLLAENAKLQAENDAHATWLNEEWPTIADRELGELVRERDEAIAKVAELTALASAAMTAGLAECERLRDEIESLADSLGDTRARKK